ncbi:MAG TPA: DoxX family protein [Nannocystis sp.]
MPIAPPAYLAPIARIFYAAVFLASVPGHFTGPTIAMAHEYGVPFAEVAVPASGVLEAVGATMVVLGYRARVGAWLLVLFLVPVTLMMHNFWAVPDPAGRQLQQIMFMKNISLIGGALLLAYFGAGPYSLDARAPRPGS